MSPAPSAHRERLVRAQAELQAQGSAAVLIGTGADLRYLTGYVAMPLERLTMLVLPESGRPSLIVPRLESMAAAASPAAAAGLVDIVPWDETDDPYAIVGARVAGGLGAAPAAGARLLVNPGLWSMHLLALERVFADQSFGLATAVTRVLRMVKGADEIELLRRAAHAADRVVAQIAAGRLLDRTEADVSAEVRDRLIAEGHDTATFGIVASGPNSASPHHAAGERVIRAGDPIVLDIGGTIDGYGSDITRTLWVTGGRPSDGPPSAFLEIFNLVRRANAAAIASARPGIACAEVDEVARSIIREGGYGDAFIHRLGHGIGLEGHEEPYLVAGNDEPLALGHAFSIEPGIYLQDRFGVRIEDIVVCTDDGPDVLNEAGRDLLVVAG